MKTNSLKPARSLTALAPAGTASAKVQLQVAPPSGKTPVTLPHGLGARIPAPGATRLYHSPRSPESLPDSVDLRPYAPPVGDQGQVNSCAAWATTYTALEFWENFLNIPTPGFGAPIANFDIAQSQGIENQGDYFQVSRNAPSTNEIYTEVEDGVADWQGRREARR